MTAPAPAAVIAPESTPRGRFTYGLLFDVLAVLERYGYRPASDRSAGQAMGLLFRLAGVYEGSLDDCCGPAPLDAEVPL